MAQKFILANGSSNLSSYFTDGELSVEIDGNIYTAVLDRQYNLSTKIPDQIIQNGFEYSEHAILQPLSISFTIIVSKTNLTEYNALYSLYNNKTVFKVQSVICNLASCVITSFDVKDNSLDTLDISLSIQEITPLIYTSQTNLLNDEYQIIPTNGDTTINAAIADTSEEFVVPAIVNNKLYSDIISGPLWNVAAHNYTVGNNIITGAPALIGNNTPYVVIENYNGDNVLEKNIPINTFNVTRDTYTDNQLFKYQSSLDSINDNKKYIQLKCNNFQSYNQNPTV